MGAGMAQSATLAFDHDDGEGDHYQSVKINLFGRYMLEDRREFPCQTIEISPIDISLSAPVRGQLGNRIVIYLDQMGRLEGTIAQPTDKGFIVRTTHQASKMDRIADKLTWLVNRQNLGMPEDRRHIRITPTHTRSKITLLDGTEIPMKIIDVSLSGAAIQADIQPPLGTHVIIGATHGSVVRHFNNGFAVEFSYPLRPEEFNEHIKL
jgi:hypothetical protein